MVRPEHVYPITCHAPKCGLRLVPCGKLRCRGRLREPLARDAITRGSFRAFRVLLARLFTGFVLGTGGEAMMEVAFRAYRHEPNHKIYPASVPGLGGNLMPLRHRTVAGWYG